VLESLARRENPATKFSTSIDSKARALSKAHEPSSYDISMAWAYGHCKALGTSRRVRDQLFSHDYPVLPKNQLEDFGLSGTDL